MPQICTTPGCPDALKGVVFPDGVPFCGACGNKLQLVAPQTFTGQAGYDAQAGYQSYMPPQSSLAAPRGKRIAAYFIDFLIALIPAFFSIFIGTIAGLIVSAFWLLRDINGASPGKAALGLTVANRAGGPSTQMQRILRNLLFGIVFLPTVIPGFGAAAASVLFSIAFLVEAISLLATGERVSDKLAGTMVVPASRVNKF